MRHQDDYAIQPHSMIYSRLLAVYDLTFLYSLSRLVHQFLSNAESSDKLLTNVDLTQQTL